MQNPLPLARAVSCLFEQLALGSGQRGFAIVDAAGGNIDIQLDFVALAFDVDDGAAGGEAGILQFGGDLGETGIAAIPSTTARKRVWSGKG